MYELKTQKILEILCNINKNSFSELENLFQKRNAPVQIKVFKTVYYTSIFIKQNSTATKFLENGL